MEDSRWYIEVEVIDDKKYREAKEKAYWEAFRKEVEELKERMKKENG